MFSRRARSPRIIAIVLATLLVLVIGVYLGGHPSWLPSGLRGTFTDQNDGRFVQDTLGLLKRDYYRKVDVNQLVNRGLTAAVASLDDPYSHYFSPTDYHAFMNQSNPHDSGIGIYGDRRHTRSAGGGRVPEFAGGACRHHPRRPDRRRRRHIAGQAILHVCLAI